MDIVERWMPVVGYEGRYSVSDHGRVRSEARIVKRIDGFTQSIPQRILSARPRPCGHLLVSLYRENIGKSWNVHQLVLAAFVGPRPEGMDCLHINGISTDNRLSNLRYGTRSENVLDMVSHGVHNHARKTHCKHGHPFDATNTYISPKSGQRKCRICVNEFNRRYRERKASA